MPSKNLSHFKGYQTQYNELMLDNLSISGKIPEWLSGSFISNGPAQFEVGETHFNHWFDGFAMLKKFIFKSGKVSFQNRFLHSQQYVKSNATGQLNKNEFATFANKTIIGRVGHSIKNLIKGNNYDNSNINTTRIGERFIAMTESNNAIEFKLHDLSTVSSFQFTDNIKSQINTAHPHLDVTTGEIINIGIEIGKVNKYHIYKIPPNSIKREIIKTYISDKLFYMHSFSITKNYVILFKSPLVLNKLKLILGFPFNDAISWQENSSSTLFVIIDRRDGTVQEIETDLFVCLHSVNAYESNNEIILDLICHHENPYSYLYLSNLETDRPNLPSGVLKRYIVNLNSKNCTHTTLSTDPQEFPRINYREVNGKKYTFIYTNLITNPVAKFFNSIRKLNVETGKTLNWERENYYPGEAIFVPRNDNLSECNGVLLSIAYNSQGQHSSLIMLDANNMQLLAEVFLPIHLPFGLHGNFYNH